MDWPETTRVANIILPNCFSLSCRVYVNISARKDFVPNETTVDFECLVFHSIPIDILY